MDSDSNEVKEAVTEALTKQEQVRGGTWQLRSAVCMEEPLLEG